MNNLHTVTSDGVAGTATGVDSVAIADLGAGVVGAEALVCATAGLAAAFDSVTGAATDATGLLSVAAARLVDFLLGISTGE